MARKPAKSYVSIDANCLCQISFRQVDASPVADAVKTSPAAALAGVAKGNIKVRNK